MKELHEYQAYMIKAEFEKLLNTLIGLLKGIEIDFWNALGYSKEAIS